MLLPMTALIAIWGHENRHFAAIKFFIFTQVSSLLMLVAIIAMAAIHKEQIGQWSFLLSRLVNACAAVIVNSVFDARLLHCFCC